jgi:hypothetical protein
MIKQCKVKLNVHRFLLLRQQAMQTRLAAPIIYKLYIADFFSHANTVDAGERASVHQ